MGNLYIGNSALFQALGYETIVPPAITQATITRGSLHAPESMCVPFKYVLGNFLEALEMGAETIFMAGGLGPCRFGLYGHTAKLILKKLGHEPRFVVIEPPAGQWVKFALKVIRLAHWHAKTIIPAIKWATDKMEITDWIEEELFMKRIAYEPKKRTAEKLYHKYVDRIFNADDYRTLDQIRHDAVDEYDALIPVDPSRDDIVDIELTGEIFILLEPFANMEIVRRLGEMGVRVSRTSSSTKWIKERVMTFLSKDVGERSHERAIRKARPWMKVPFGGEGIETIGHTVEAAEKGMHGIIQVMPFSCMPEVSAKDILPEVARQVGIPFYSFIFDEHAGGAGFQTRLESFVERVRDNRDRKRKASNKTITV